MSLSEYVEYQGEYEPKIYSVGQNEYRVETPWGTAYVRVEGNTLYITLPDGQVVVIDTWWAWWSTILYILMWIVYMVLWWWASGELKYHTITRVIGLLFPGLATIGEALIRK